MINTKKINKTFAKQLDQSDCGVACLLSLIKYYEGSYSLENLREISGTTKQGSTLLGLYQGAQKCGLTPQGLKGNVTELKKLESPVILHVLIDKRLQHYVVCYGFENGHFIIGDPGKGVVSMTSDELESIWQSKALLSLETNDDFIRTEQIKSGRVQWYIQLLKDDYPFLTVIFVLSLLVSLLGMATSIFSQKLLDDILPSKDISKLVIGLGSLLMLLFGRGFIGYLTGFLVIKQGRDFNNRLINRFYNSLLFLPKSFFDNRRVGELVARMNDTARIQSAIASVVGDLLKNALLFITGEVILFIYSWQAGLVTLIAIPVYGLISWHYHSGIVDGQREVMAANAHKSGNYINTMQGIDAVKAHNKEDKFAEINRAIYGFFQEKVFNLGKLGISLQVVAEVTGVIILMGLLSVCSYYVVIDKLTTGELMAIISISGYLFPAITSLAFANITLQGARVAFDRMYEFSTMPPEEGANPSNDATFPVSKLIIDSLQVKEVSFRFPGRAQLIKHVNFSVEKGSMTVLLGESGNGKTTLMNILQKFYQPENGTVLVNGAELQTIPTAVWRSSIGVVPQKISLFNGTLLDNLVIDGTEEDVKRCLDFCKTSGFEDYFKTFPQGYATLLGEEGVNISGGQCQLVALARILWQKPSLLLLDEPTSAMDRNMENFVLQLLNGLKRETSVFLITHRLKIAQKADVIYILSDGKTTSYGSHHQLITERNLYSEMYEELRIVN